jgi:hypothetical protein
MVEKVTDQLKIVTDELVLKQLVEQGIDSAYVEFYQDYTMPAIVDGKKEKGKSPYAKFYRDLKSNKRFMVVSGLPMVDADGVKIECGWKVADINYFAEKNNLFQAKVQGTQVEITVRNDQSDGRKAGDKLTFQAQVYLDNLEVLPANTDAIRLPVDPINSNYTNNVLEWDYGICKRRLRIIEGSILGSWVFAIKPAGEVRIKYNQTGDYKLKLGQYAIDNDTEFIPASVFDTATYPFTVSDSATFYPDANPETTSVDGYAKRDVAEGTWNSIVTGAGTAGDANSDNAHTCRMYAGDSANTWVIITRGFYLFDTSGLPDSATISEAILSLYGYYKADNLSATPSINIYTSNPASNTNIVAADYSTLGATALSTAITYANWIYADPFWNNFALNAAGRAAISTTGVSKFGTRNPEYDVANSPPPFVANQGSYISAYNAEQGNGYKPKLVVTYAIPQTYEGAATLSGTGTLVGIGVGTFIGKSTLSGAGTLVAKGVGTFVGTVILSGTGNLSAIGRRIFTGVATLAGGGALSAIGRLTAIGEATLSGIGNLSGIGHTILTGIATLTGTGTLSAVGSFLRFGKAVLSGVGSLTANGVITSIGKATLSGIGTLATVGRRIFMGAATLSGSGTLASIGRLIATGKATLTGVGTLAGIGRITAIGKATLSGIGTLIVAGTTATTHYGAALLSGIGTLGAIGRGIFTGSSTLTGTGSLSTIGRGIFSGSAIMSGVGALTTIGRRLYQGVVSLSGIGSLSAVGHGIFTGITTFSGVGTLSAIGRRIYEASATLSGSGALACKSILTVVGKAVLTGTGSLSVIGTKLLIGSVAFIGTGVLAGKGSLTAIGKATLEGVGTLIAKAFSTFGKRRYGNNFPDETEIRTTKPTGSGRYG